MAITIEQQPSNYQSIYNDIIYVFSSDNTGEDNFRFLIDVYIDGVLTTRHRTGPRPTFTSTLFQVNRIIEDYVTSDIDTSTDDFGTNDNSHVLFNIKIGEEYVVANVLTQFADLATTTEIQAFNASLEWLESIDFSVSDYLLADSTKKFLTNSPLAQDIEIDQYQWLHSMVAAPGDYATLRLIRYDSAGTPIGTTNLVNPFTAVTDDNEFVRAGVGPQNFVDSQGAGFMNSVDTYTVQAFDGVGPTAISEMYTFTVTTECRYETVRLQWLNKLGGYDAKNFTKVSRKSTDITRAEYKQVTGTFTGTAFTNAKTDRQSTELFVNSSDKILMNSDNLTESELLWLKELETSPIVYQELNGELIAVTGVASTFEEKTQVNDKVFNLTVSVKYAVQNNRQRG